MEQTQAAPALAQALDAVEQRVDAVQQVIRLRDLNSLPACARELLQGLHELALQGRAARRGGLSNAATRSRVMRVRGRLALLRGALARVGADLARVAEVLIPDAQTEVAVYGAQGRPGGSANAAALRA